jgi:hypothetical protein
MRKYVNMLYHFHLRYCKRIINRKNLLLTVLIFFLIMIYVTPIKNFVYMSGYARVTPYIYPFLLTDPNFLVIFMAGSIYFYSGVPFMNRWNNYYLLRIGRIQWVTGQIIHIVISALAITIITIVLTLVVLLPYVHIERGWGNVLYTLAKTDAKEMCGLFWKISVQYMSQNSPLTAMVGAIVVSTLGIVFIGILMLCCALLFSRTFSIIMATALVAYSSVVVNMGDHAQRGLTLTSPISWMRIADFGVTRFGIRIGLSYGFAVCSYLALTVLLMMFIYHRIGKIDFIWNNEDE